MSEYNEGDLIEAVKGDTVIRGRLVLTGGRFLLSLTVAMASDLLHLEANGYTVTTIEKAFTLPTDRGAVVRIANEGDRWLWLCWRAGNGTWDVIDFRGKGHTGITDPLAWIREQGETVKSVTRLEPVADTAKKMRDRILEEFKRDTNRSYSEDVAFVATEFGVTS